MICLEGLLNLHLDLLWRCYLMLCQLDGNHAILEVRIDLAGVKARSRQGGVGVKRHNSDVKNAG